MIWERYAVSSLLYIEAKRHKLRKGVPDVYVYFYILLHVPNIVVFRHSFRLIHNDVHTFYIDIFHKQFGTLKLKSI